MDTGTDMSEAEKLARLFHVTYERLAPQFGYETRQDTRAFDPESANGRLMIAVCESIITQMPSATGYKKVYSGRKVSW
jgi:hypothetical protein